jgi:hypothetical protein
MSGHLLHIQADLRLACFDCKRLMTLDEFLAMGSCIDPAEWTAAALDYVQHAPELAK